MTNSAFPSKHACVLYLLSRRQGASIEDIMAATGWQNNSTRGMLAGLRKRGFGIESHRVESTRRYYLKTLPECG